MKLVKVNTGEKRNMFTDDMIFLFMSLKIREKLVEH